MGDSPPKPESSENAQKDDKNALQQHIELSTGQTAAYLTKEGDLSSSSRTTLHSCEDTAEKEEHQQLNSESNTQEVIHRHQSISVAQIEQPKSIYENDKQQSDGFTSSTADFNGAALNASNKKYAEAENGIFGAKEEEHENPNDCGCVGYHPHWLQRYRTPIVFMINYSLLGILRGAYFHYTISSLSTIEKRYAFPSRYSSIILIADNVSAMILNPVVGYLATRVNGPKLIGCGMLICATSSIMSGMPYFIFGPSSHLLSESDLQLDPSHSTMLGMHSGSTPASVLATAVSALPSSTQEFCDSTIDNCKTNPHPFELYAFLFLVVASFVNGVGYCGFWTIGLPYLDDNVKRRNSPIYISVSTVIRMLGVTVGYFISSFSLSLYEDPSLKPNIAKNDPRWVGAWWLGFIVLGILMAIFTIPFFLFPASMKKNSKKVDKHLSFTDAMKVLKKLCRNPILVMDTVGGAIRAIGFAGYWINKPRYIEAQFNTSAATSSFLTGATSIVMKAVGILLGGIFMSKFQPSPRTLVSLIVIVEIICNSLMFSAMFVGCPSPKFAHISYEERKMYDLPCNQDCRCTQAVFQPVCSSDGKTNYFSPCYAGCKAGFSNRTSGEKMQFFNCACDPGPLTSGYCKAPPGEECDALTTYLIILSVAGIVSSFARTPNIMIAMRSVDKDNKSFAFGVVESFFSLFCYIPYPVIFSFVTDAACIIWENSCGKSGNCWLYDLTRFRYLLHGAAVSLMMIGTLFDIGIWFYADRLKGLYEEEEDEDEEHPSSDLPHKLPLAIDSKDIIDIKDAHELAAYENEKISKTN